ncbi:restriction endonuclease [Nocardia takedensis]
MTGLDPMEVQEFLRRARSATDTDAQGKAYEALAAYLFESIPGCFTDRDLTSYFRTEQIDVAVANNKQLDGLFALPHVFLIECKNWSSPVDSSTLGYFINILRSRGVEVGILIAANGITGDAQDKTNAHALGISALKDGIKVLILTTEDIEKLTTSADLVELIIRRFLRAYGVGGLGAP